ncbi:hypothetical protein B0H19DRAFT_1190093 [Mycena capillaripes]|nr:hypothetical protein B0H19DRAFT_1190093 [Mycena capillaripes]
MGSTSIGTSTGFDGCEGCAAGEERCESGVRGDMLARLLCGLDGSSSGTTAPALGRRLWVCARGGARYVDFTGVVFTMREASALERSDAARSPSWCASRSDSPTPSSQSSTSKNSRSIRPTSRFPNTPVHSAQWTFFSVESLVYFEATMTEPRKTRSKAHSSRAMERCGRAREMYTSATRTVAGVTSARVRTFETKVVNFWR